MLQEKGRLFFRLLANRCFSGKPEELTKLLQDNELNTLQLISPTWKNPSCLLFRPDTLLETIHYSWLEPTLKKVPEPLLSCVLHTLPTEYAQALVTRGISSRQALEKAKNYPQPVRNFLLGIFFSQWEEGEVLPKELLPESDLQPLLECTKVELMDLIDLLAMYDLAEEVRHIVDKKLLQAIVSILSIPQQKYLRNTLHHKQKTPSTPLQVKTIYKDRKKFLHTLHKRGIGRLAFSLSGKPANFTWYPVHILDIGRGTLLRSLIQKEEIPTITQVARLQVLQALQFLRTKE